MFVLVPRDGPLSAGLPFFRSGVPVDFRGLDVIDEDVQEQLKRKENYLGTVTERVVISLNTLITNYAIRTFRSSGAAFGDAFIYESSRAPNSSQYEAFFLGSADIRGFSFKPYTVYAGINNDLLSVNQVDSNTTHAKLAGCNHTNSVPFSWNYTFPDTGPVTEHVDSVSGKTSLYFVTATTSGQYESAVYHQTGTGLVQTYKAPGAAMLQNTPDQGGEQPPNPNAH